MTDAEMNSPPLEAIPENEQVKKRRISPSKESFCFDKATNTESDITKFALNTSSEIPPETLVYLQQRATLENLLIGHRRATQSLVALPSAVHNYHPESQDSTSGYLTAQHFADSTTAQPWPHAQNLHISSHVPEVESCDSGW